MRALSGPRTPVSGRFDWSAADGAQRFEHVDLRTPETHVRLTGRVARDGKADLALDARSSDLTASDALVMRLRRALGNPAAAAFEVAGTGSFDGRWRGTLTAPVYEGRVTAADVFYLGVSWGRAEWVGRAAERAIECRSLVLRKGGGELWIDGRLEPGEYAKKDAVDVRVRLDTWPAEDLVQALDWDLRWEGPVSGGAQIRGRRSAPRGTADLTGSAGRYYDVPYASLRLETTLQGDRIRAEHGEAVIGGGSVRFAGLRTDAGVYDGSLEADDVDIGELLPPARADVRWGGRLSGTASLQGTFEKPKLRVQVASRRIFLGDEGLGALDAEVGGHGDGRVTVRARFESPRTHVELEGQVEATTPYRARVTARGRETSLDPFLRAMLAAPSASLPPVIASGELTLDGPLARPAELTASARVPDLQVSLPDYPVRSEGPLLADLASGTLTIRELRLGGEGTNLLASGRADLFRGDGPLELTVKGDADLRSLAAITRRFRARGAAQLTLDVGGTRDAPQLDGALRLQGAGVRVKDFPHGLEEVHGAVRFTERAAQLQDVVGRLGGGEVRLEGETAYGRGRLLSMDLKVSGRDIALRYPEGLRSVTGGELRLFGDGERQWLTGSVEIRQAVWTRRYDVVSEILDAQQALAAPAGTLGTPVRFDIKVNAPGTVRVDNNLATLEARADLRLQGTSDNPVVVGRADVDRGRVYFQGNTYLIRRGRIEFANPHRLDPFFDMEAETRLRSYRVNLRMNGTLDRVYPTLTSDPPLSSVQILNLLAGAEESEVAGLADARTDRALLASQGAASLAAGRLSEGVGLERRAERLFGLDRFSIDPSVLKGGVTRPAARITVGKRLTPDLNVLYSQDLSGNEERLISVEYTLRDWLSMLLTRTEPGGFGVDARVQRSR
jgi:translocation and assembly module TamB